MDDYRDQDKWYEVQIEVPGYGWLTLDDYDDRVNADGQAEWLRERNPKETYRVRPVRGQS